MAPSMKSAAMEAMSSPWVWVFSAGGVEPENKVRCSVCSPDKQPRHSRGGFPNMVQESKTEVEPGGGATLIHQVYVLVSIDVYLGST